MKGAGEHFPEQEQGLAKLAGDRLEAFLCQARWRWAQGQPWKLSGASLPGTAGVGPHV